jgi:hypothetical protein
LSKSILYCILLIIGRRIEYLLKKIGVLYAVNARFQWFC